MKVAQDTQTSLAPSGRQFEFSLGAQRAVVVEVGGGIRAYTLGERAVLDGYAVDQMCTGARGAPLVPWPNRLADGAYTFEGSSHQLALTEPEKQNAIHGLLRWRNWSLRGRDDAAIVLGTVLRPLPGYPFALDVEVEYALHPGSGDPADPAGLTVSTTARNLGETRCPYAAGAHPYLAPGTEVIDAATLTLDAATWLATDDRGLPTGRCDVAGSALDFRAGRTIGPARIDNAFTDLARDAQGRAWVHLQSSQGWVTRLWVDEHYPFIEIYSGDTQPPDRRRRGLGVEPMTCAPNGFNSGDGLIHLDPGQSITTSWGIVPDPPPGQKRAVR